MTERLYDNSALTSFEAKVTACTETKGGFEITLDRSAFFPEGGGQAGDSGRIGGVCVRDTYERNGEVYHLCSAPIEAGTAVSCQVDADIRLRRMQNHSGEHLLMGFIHRKLGFENVGFRLGSSDVTLDLDGLITADELSECEQLANEAIARDVPITVSYPDEEALSAMHYRSKEGITGRVRIVTIEGIDVCACCAPHLSSTGQIGIVRVLYSESCRSGTRVHIRCGLDALALIRQQADSVSEISRLLSARPDRVTEYVRRLLDENLSLKRELAAIEKQRADEIISSLGSEKRGSFCIFTKGLRRETLREIANRTVKLTDGAAAVFCEEDGGFGYIIASDNIPLRARTAEINRAISGRGGGSDKMIEGHASADRETVGEYIKTL